MSQHYSDETRETDPYALPNVEVFYLDSCAICEGSAVHTGEECDGCDGEEVEPDWYFWTCFPGCLPDSDPIGPYDTEQAAIDAAREE